MAASAVVIKSNPSGLIFILDQSIPFQELCLALEEKLSASKAFFKGAKLAVGFQGRTLTEEEEITLTEVIVKHGGFQVICVIDQTTPGISDAAILKKLEEQQFTEESYFYRGTLTSGEKLERDSSIVIMGDVNPGAQVKSRGNIVVFGSCMGLVHAGCDGNQNAFIAALILKPNLLRIADKSMRSVIVKKEDLGEYPIEPKVAFMGEDGRVKINTITQQKIGDYFVPAE